MDTTCAICHVPIVSLPGKKPRQYCGAACRTVASRRRKDPDKAHDRRFISCAVCGARHSGSFFQAYCSLACQQEAHARGGAFCDVCDRPLVLGAHNKRHCSGTCATYAAQWRKQQGIDHTALERACAVCGATFRGGVDAKFCSWDCQYRDVLVRAKTRRAQRGVRPRGAPWPTDTDEYREARREYNRRYTQKLRQEVFAAYGGPRCACCGEERDAFLSLDHIEGGGRQHRASINGPLNRWLRAQGYPPGYRVLCFNCNQARGIYGRCPHELERATPDL